MTDRRLEEAIRHFHPPPGFKPWHGGASVLGSIRGISAAMAGWKPYPDRHSIRELAVHVAYWNYAVWRRLGSQGERGAFPLSPANWPELGPVSEGAWEMERRLVREWHERLLETLRAFDPGRLDQPAGGGATTYADLITGVVLHDTYHAGQIQLMKRLAASRDREQGRA